MSTLKEGDRPVYRKSEWRREEREMEKEKSKTM